MANRCLAGAVGKQCSSLQRTLRAEKPSHSPISEQLLEETHSDAKIALHDDLDSWVL